VLFRSAAIPLLLSAGMSRRAIVFLSPITFGLAHIHHFYEFRITHPHVHVAAAIARSVFQLTYTSLFGAYATFLFLRTGSLLSIVLVHAFCNSMGLPRFWGKVQPYWAGGSERELRRASLAWTGVYYVLLFAGALTWWRNLRSFTESGAALTEIDF
jgi:prenyl protein peptidase